MWLGVGSTPWWTEVAGTCLWGCFVGVVGAQGLICGFLAIRSVGCSFWWLSVVQGHKQKQCIIKWHICIIPKLFLLEFTFLRTRVTEELTIHLKVRAHVNFLIEDDELYGKTGDCSILSKIQNAQLNICCTLIFLHCYEL